MIKTSFSYEEDDPISGFRGGGMVLNVTRRDVIKVPITKVFVVPMMVVTNAGKKAAPNTPKKKVCVVIMEVVDTKTKVVINIHWQVICIGFMEMILNVRKIVAPNLPKKGIDVISVIIHNHPQLDNSPLPHKKWLILNTWNI